MKKKLLIVSYSIIRSDARILKQINLFKDEWDITTIGYGDRPDGVTEHLSITHNNESFKLNGRLITLKAYRLVYWTQPGVRETLEHLKGRSFDMVFANEIEAIPVALRATSTYGVHADLHEYHPSYYEYRAEWNRRIRPYIEWLCRKYLPKVNSITAASEGFARKYEEVFGVTVAVVINAAPYADLSPTPAHSPLRLVHHGGAQRNRKTMLMMEAVAASSADVTLDLFFTPIDPTYVQEMRDYAESHPNITVHDPIPYPQLIESLNQYDVGLHLLPSGHYNHTWALSNKMLDYVQARVGVIASPTPGTKPIMETYNLGAITEGYEAKDLTPLIDALDADTVRAWKENAHRVAEELCAEKVMGPWSDALDITKLQRRLR